MQFRKFYYTVLSYALYILLQSYIITWNIVKRRYTTKGNKTSLIWVKWEIKRKRRTFNIVSEYDQEIPHSQTESKPMTPRGRATQYRRDTWRQTKQSNQLPPSHQDDCKKNAQRNTEQLQNLTMGATNFLLFVTSRVEAMVVSYLQVYHVVYKYWQIFPTEEFSCC